MTNLKTLGLAAMVCALSACSAVTTLSTTQAGGSVRLAGDADRTAPRQVTRSTRSFGYDEFKAEAPGQAPLYGVLPLKFNGGYLASSILFFTPAMLYSLREVYPEYEFDIAGRQVRYRKGPDAPWQTYTPDEEDRETARQFFEGAESVAPFVPAAKP